jgi:hypothetical protein
MWSRRFLLTGLASAVVAAVMALTFLWLLLVGLERAGVIDQMASAIVAVGLPGVVVYPLCWHALIYRRHSYTRRDTDKLIACTYGACALVAVAILSVWYFVQAIATAKEFVLNISVSGWALSFVWVPVVIAIAAATFALFLAVPFVAIAGPIAFAHRALLLAWFGPATAPDDCATRCPSLTAG